jgi:CheY-like chemotaxis protein
LPCSWQPQREVELAPERARTARRRPSTILLVEDESAVRAVTRAILEEDGHQVLEAEDGDAALALARTRSGIDAVLTDLVMPRRGGLSLAKELRMSRPELPVLMMSGHLPRSDVPLPAPLVRKPFTRDELTTAVNSLLESHAAAEISPTA